MKHLYLLLNLYYYITYTIFFWCNQTLLPPLLCIYPQQGHSQPTVWYVVVKSDLECEQLTFFETCSVELHPLWENLQKTQLLHHQVHRTASCCIAYSVTFVAPISPLANLKCKCVAAWENSHILKIPGYWEINRYTYTWSNYYLQIRSWREATPGVHKGVI